MPTLLDLETSRFDWGIKDEKIVRDLAEEFPSVQDIIDTDLNELRVIDGVGPALASQIKRMANQIREEHKIESKNKKSKDKENLPSVLDKPLLDHIPTKRELEELEAEDKNEEDENEYILVEKPVDKFYTRRYRIKITPATCRECGYDVVEVNKLSSWDSLSDIEQSAVLKTLHGHIQKYHSNPSGKKIVSGRELKDTNWLNPETSK